MKRGSRKDGTTARQRGINPRALGTNPKAVRRVREKCERMGWNPPEEPSGMLPRWLRFEIFKRDSFRCSYCGATPRKHGAYLQVDHIIPKAAGGTDDPANLTTACEDCNAGKAARLLTESCL